MKTVQRHCRKCSNTPDDETEHKVLGFIPRAIFERDNDGVWVNASVCTECGGLTFKEPTEEEIDQAEERYLSLLVRLNLMSNQERKEILGIK